MIRLYLTTWSYIIDTDGRKESRNPILDYIEANDTPILYGVLDSTMTNGEHDNPNVLIILKGDVIPDAINDIVGVKRIPIGRFDMTVAEIPPARRQIINNWLQANTGIDTTKIKLSTTIKQIVKAIARDINPSFQSFGAHYESLVNDWE